MANANINPVDIAIASCIDKDLKACASTAALSACECMNPELRSTLAGVSQTAIQRQHQFSQMMMQKGIYVPPGADTDTINLLMPQIEAAILGIGAGAANRDFTLPTGGLTTPRPT